MNRHGMRTAASAAVLLSVLVLRTGPAPAQTAAKQFLIFDPPGSTATYVGAITNAGMVLGSYTDASGATHGFLRDTRGRYVTIDVPGAEATVPTSINPQGEIVGAYCVGSASDCSHPGFAGPASQGFVRAPNGSIRTFSVPAGFGIWYGMYSFGGGAPPGVSAAGTIVGTYARWAPQVGFEEYGFLRTRKGKFFTINPPGTQSLEALAINRAGTIIGDYSTATVSFVGFVLSADGVFTSIDLPGCKRELENSIPLAINSAGTVTGTAYCDSPWYYGNYVRTPDGTVTLFAPPGTDSEALAISAAGFITGYACNPNCIPFLRSPDGTITTLDLPGTTWGIPLAINGSGTVAGMELDSANVPHGFLWFTRDDRGAAAH